MLESIFIATDGRSAKTKSTNVAKKISNASTDINSAKKELNNVDLKKTFDCKPNFIYKVEKISEEIKNV